MDTITFCIGMEQPLNGSAVSPNTRDRHIARRFSENDLAIETNTKTLFAITQHAQ